MVQPGDCPGENLISAALCYGRTGVTEYRGPKASIVRLETTVETLRQPVLRVEIDGANERGRAIGLRLQQFR